MYMDTDLHRGDARLHTMQITIEHSFDMGTHLRVYFVIKGFREDSQGGCYCYLNKTGRNVVVTIYRMGKPFSLAMG